MSNIIPERRPQLPVHEIPRGITSHWSPFWRSEFRLSDDQLSQPLRFGLGELFAAVTVAAVLLALFRSLGIIGAALAFIAAVAFTNLIYPWLNRDSLARQETMFDFVWGALMPLVCLVFDPFVFKSDPHWLGESFSRLADLPFPQPLSLYPWSIAAYAFIACQLLILCVWLVAGRLPVELPAAWAGMLWTGFALACIVGGILFAPALFGILFAGIGLLGLTPLFTARAYYRRAILAAAIATRELPSPRAERLALLGYWLALPVPAVGMILVWILFARL